MTEFEKDKTGEISAQSSETTTELDLDTIRCGVYRYFPDLTAANIFDIDKIRGEVYISEAKYDAETKTSTQFMATLLKPGETKPSLLSDEDHELLSDENSVLLQYTRTSSKRTVVLAEAAFNTEKDNLIYADESGVLTIEDGETSITTFEEGRNEQSVLQSASEFSAVFRQSAPTPIFKADRKEKEQRTETDKATPVGSVAAGSQVQVATG